MSESSSRSSTPPSSASARRRPPHFDQFGVDPCDIIGKILRRVRRSSIHPAVTMDFTDNTTFQILVDGYDPVYPGIPKQLEMDPPFEEILATGEPVDLPVIDCALVSLSDKAFERKHWRDPNEVQWDQSHYGVAIKFAEENSRWHCIWATLQEYDMGLCVFRSYNDVYLDRLQRSPTKNQDGHRIRPRTASA